MTGSSQTVKISLVGSSPTIFLVGSSQLTTVGSSQTVKPSMAGSSPTITHQIGFTRANYAWIALNLLLNTLVLHSATGQIARG